MARLVLGFTRPKNPILGMELAGRIESVGKDVTLFKPGDDRVIDYTQQDFTEGDETYDVVFDAVGKLQPSRAKRPLGQKGVYLNVNKDSGPGGGSPEDLGFLKNSSRRRRSGRSSTNAIRWRRSSRPTPYVEKGHKKGHVVVTVA